MSEFDAITVERPLVLVGCGKMGGALLKGWLAGGLAPAAVWIVEPAADNVKAQFADGTVPADKQVADDHIIASVDMMPENLIPSFIVLAVKPQIMDVAAPGLNKHAGADTAFISIAAGKNLEYFSEQFGDDVAIIRTMPNTPAAIGQGTIVGVASEHAGAQQKRVCEAMMSAVGRFFWLDDEALMDAVTAVSGSGPAYIFYMAECLAAAGKAAGLPQELAADLAMGTITGAGALLEQSDQAPAVLRRNVTSPRGTTEAALDVLMARDGLASLMRKAVAAAAERSRELSG